VNTLRLYKKVLENKVRDAEIENITLQQKAYPVYPVVKGRKNFPMEVSFNPQQYYQSLISKSKYLQKGPPDSHNGSYLADIDRQETAPSFQKEDIRSSDLSNFTANKIDSDKLEEKRVSSVGGESRFYADDFSSVGAGVLPKLRENKFEAGESKAATLEPFNSSQRKGNNVWLSGLFKKRANSTLRKMNTGNFKKDEKSEAYSMDRRSASPTRLAV